MSNATKELKNEPQTRADRPIGLCLSGGGSRAIAFHLGCLRAMNTRGLLSKVDVISTVSGGSVIGAMYAYSDDSFDDFDMRVQDVLRRGFIKSIARQMFFSPIGLKIAGTKFIAGSTAMATSMLRTSVAGVERMIPRATRSYARYSDTIQPPLRRWASRTTAFEAALASRLFGDQQITSARRGDINTVINACELRTGTAFRFGSRESGTWRFGTLEANHVSVAMAVAASAAYPALLPAIDRFFAFNPIGGNQTRDRRVILTDGGVYDNLGVTCMEPGKDVRFSTNVYAPQYIICCDAGPGQFDDTPHPYGWVTRMERSFGATFRQVQTGTQSRLHQWREHERIKGFVYAYLGQQDRRLTNPPDDFVPRDRVVNYPTDFSPMPAADIAAISKRGEQLTNMLMELHCSDI
ncbi:patatin-like phospholipase family protein [Rhodopirellula bahusiensis]|uniref:patatin-like phospholipase family protein n=1 Tax=Rhodopirellula bahusiensis TaxID=2014065 RepID=UPI003264786C